MEVLMVGERLHVTSYLFSNRVGICCGEVTHDLLLFRSRVGNYLTTEE